MRYLYHLYFKLFGWKFDGKIPHHLPKFIIIVAPHTSNSDFFLGIMVRSLLRLKNAKYLGKSSLFKPPFGFIFSWLGGYPVDRSKFNNLVEAVADIFNSKDKFIIALAPEGTRKKVEKLKTGFYHIAKKAQVPIVAIGFDYGSKTIHIMDPFIPGDSIKDDFKKVIEFFSQSKGDIPENGVTLAMIDRMNEEFENE